MRGYLQSTHKDERISGDARQMGDRESFERERLVSLIIDVGMMRRDVATDVADAVLSRWRLASKVEDAVWETAFKTDIARLREKLATAHKLMFEANAHLARTCRGEDADVDKAASKIALAIRSAA
jgi:hypothetical protein